MGNTAKKILIVDDEENIRKVLGLYFKKEGFTVIESGDGNEALSLAEEEKPYLMILDNMLPGLTGLDICKTLKASETTRDIIIVMLSADGRIRETEPYQSGADMYEQKPFSPKKLLTDVMQFAESA